MIDEPRSQPPSELRVPGDTPEHDEFRSRLYACAVAGDGDAALDVLGEMEAAGFTLTRDDHLLVLVAYQMRGRAEEAETYLRALPWTMVTESHLNAVLSAFALARRADDVERLYEEFENGPVPPDDRCRMALLAVFGMAQDPERARRWFDRLEPQPDSAAYPLMLARLIDAHAFPEARDDLVAVYESIDPEVRHDRHVSAALVFAFAAADDPERAEACLVAAVGAPGDADSREAMITAVLRAYRRQVHPAVARILALADEAGVDIEHRRQFEDRDVW